MLCQKSLYESCRMARRIVVMKSICSLRHWECDGHTVHKLSQRRLTADWLAPRESDFSRMHSKVSSDWLPSYITATRPVLEIFKMAGYFPDSPRNLSAGLAQCYNPPNLYRDYSCYLQDSGILRHHSLLHDCTVILTAIWLGDSRDVSIGSLTKCEGLNKNNLYTPVNP